VKLLYQTHSPFARKVLVAILEGKDGSQVSCKIVRRQTVADQERFHLN
jgi:hypothetical protein